MEQFIAGIYDIITGTVVRRKATPIFILNFGDGMAVNINIRALERKDGLFRITHDHYVVFTASAFLRNIQENRLENVPLQLVRVLKFINNRIAVSFTELFDKPAIPIHDRIMNRIDHVAKGLRLALTFFILPQIHQFFNMVEDKLLERLDGFLLQILVFKFKEEINGIVQFIGLPNATPFFRKRTRKKLVRTVERFDSLDKI